MSTLERFLEDLYTNYIQFQISKEEVDAIKMGVETLINRIVAKITTSDERLQISNLIKVGGFYEGTKIGEPNEFDFLVEMEDFKNSDIYSFEVACHQNPYSVHCLVNTEYYYRRWLNEEVRLGNTSMVFPPKKIFGILCSATEHAIMGLRSSQEHTWQNELGCIQVYEPREYGTGIFGPNAMIEMTWTSESVKTAIDVSADITACIPCPEYITDKWNLAIDPSMKKNVLMVPPSSSNLYEFESGLGGSEHCCWRLSCTPLEVAAMNAMHEVHRKCYKIMKYICKGSTGDKINQRDGILAKNHGLKLLSSYMLKNVVMHHNAKCVNSIKSVSICLRQMFDLLLDFHECECLPVFFMPSLNAWSKDNFTKETRLPDVIPLFHKTVFETIAGVAPGSYNFDNCHSTLLGVINVAAKMELETLMTE